MTQILRKLVMLIPTVLFVSALTFGLMALLPGNPALACLGGAEPTAELIRQVEIELRLDRPIHIRYLEWMGDALRGDFGRSCLTREPVMEAILNRLPVTLEIGLLAIGFALLLSVPLGMLSAYRANSLLDRGIATLSFGLLAIPSFMMALMLMYLLAVNLRVLPVIGWVPLTRDPLTNLRHAVMPALALSLSEMAIYTRLLRTDMIATLQEDYVAMARAKGLPTWRILLRHALRPSSFSLLTIVGLQLGAIVGGSVIVETFFALPGVGRLLFDSIGTRDFVMVQGVVLFLAVATVLANFLVDVTYSILDPRIRRGRAAA